MRGFPNFRSFGFGPRIKPNNCCPIANQYLYMDYYFDPDFWLNAYHTFRITGISSKIPIKFDFTIAFAAKGSKGYYKITNTQETYAANDTPANQGFSVITDKAVVDINNGQYLSISLDSSLLGIDADYATLQIKNNYTSDVIAYYTLELYAP